MPVLDNSDVYAWFTMPLAGDTAETLRLQLAEDANLRELVTAVCAGLGPAHEAGWIHRDLKPSNLLQLDGQWTVADWGMTRRPRGQTTDPDRTRAGAPFGTDGWAAPELSADAHAAGPQADIYSIGQIIGWAIIGQQPLANIPLIPDNRPWREIVTTATHFRPRPPPRNGR
jgi:serine/threonine protein kinase